MPVPPKGIKEKAPVSPKSDKTENPHEEHPVTNIPKTVLPPTAKLNFAPGACRVLMAL